MRTNLISIVDQPPIFPVSHVESMVDRLGSQLEAFEGAQGVVAHEALASLFCVHDAAELVDKEGFITEYELQPAVNREELSKLAERLMTALPDTVEIEIARAKLIVRNTINCVPRSLEDLADYVEPETIGFINTGFFIQSRDLAPADKSLHMTFLDSMIPKVEPSDRQLILSMAHDSLTEKGVDCHTGLTERQRLLERAGVYYALHRYGSPAASLWLARFLNPLVFCTCPHFDCGARHWGFTDGLSAAILVLENLPYIESFFDNKDSAIPLSEGVTSCDICGNHLIEVLYGAEAFMLIDQERVEETNILKLLQFVADRLSYLPELHQIRFKKVVLAMDFIYPGSYQRIRGLPQDRVDFMLDSMKEFQQYTQKNPERPTMEMMPLWDANNFMAFGMDMNDIQLGMKLHTLFLSSAYAPDLYEAMALIVEELLDNPDVPERNRKVLVGYLTNYAYVLARRSVATTAFCYSVMNFGESSEAVDYLAEFGYWPAMQGRKEDASTPAEAKYWAERIRQVRKQN